MADLYLSITAKNQITADTESVKVYDWLTKELGSQGLSNQLFDAIAFIAHEIAHNRLMKNSLTRQLRLRLRKTNTEITLSIRYDGEQFSDTSTNGSGPQGIQGMIKHVNAKYDANATEGDESTSAGENLYTTTRIIFPIR